MAETSSQSVTLGDVADNLLKDAERRNVPASSMNQTPPYPPCDLLVVQGMMRRGGMPPRHLERETTCLFGSEPWSAAWDSLVSAIAEGRSLFMAIVGPRGTGKTQLAVEGARRVCEIESTQKTPQERPAVYAKAMGIFVEIRQAMKGDDGEAKAIQKYVSPKMLIIDEIQERGETEWEDRVLTHILDKRYDDPKKHTLILGNLKPDDVAKSLGSSVTSRIRECGNLIVCDWPSFR